MQTSPLTGIPGLRPAATRGKYEVFDPVQPAKFSLVDGYFPALDKLITRRGYFATFGCSHYDLSVTEVRRFRYAGRRVGSFGYGIYLRESQSAIARFHTSEQAYQFIVWAVSASRAEYGLSPIVDASIPLKEFDLYSVPAPPNDGVEADFESGEHRVWLWKLDTLYPGFRTKVFLNPARTRDEGIHAQLDFINAHNPPGYHVVYREQNIE